MTKQFVMTPAINWLENNPRSVWMNDEWGGYPFPRMTFSEIAQLRPVWCPCTVDAPNLNCYSGDAARWPTPTSGQLSNDLPNQLDQLDSDIKWCDVCGVRTIDGATITACFVKGCGLWFCCSEHVYGEPIHSWE